MSLFFYEGGTGISISYWLQKDPKFFLEALKSFFLFYIRVLVVNTTLILLS